ncbi:MAG: hypothetical protein ACE5J3_07455, partial [Methanosarcinales archaeon]
MNNPLHDVLMKLSDSSTAVMLDAVKESVKVLTPLVGTAIASPLSVPIGFALFAFMNQTTANLLTNTPARILAKKAKKWDEEGKHAKLSVFAKSIAKLLGADVEDVEKSKESIKELIDKLAKDESFQKELEEKFEKFLTGGYKDGKEFEADLKELFGTDTTIDAFDLYLQFKDFLYSRKNLEILCKISGLEDKQEEVIVEFNKRQEILEDTLREFGKKYIALDQGFIKLTPLYFEGRKVKKNPWTDKFRLVHIKEGCDVRRKITKDIESAIKSKENILLLGESGSGKTLVLYRIIMDYYNKGYTVLFKEGSETFEKPTKVIDLIREYADTNDVLVAVDNVHWNRNIRAFEIIDKLRDLEEDKNIVCVFAARKPELDDLLTKDLLKKDFELVDTIEKLRKETCEFKLGNLDFEEAVLFVEKYHESKNEQLI